MNISYQTAEQSQTLQEYNLEIAEAEAEIERGEIERGEFTTADGLKKEASSW